MRLNFDVDEAKARFGHDGVLCLPNVLSAEVLALAQECYEWTLAHPGPSAGSVLLGTPGTFYQDQANPAAFESSGDRLTKLAHRRRNAIKLERRVRRQGATASA